jgi:hypothetical protein
MRQLLLARLCPVAVRGRLPLARLRALRRSHIEIASCCSAAPMPVMGSHDLSHGAPLLVPLHSTSACNRPPLRLTSHTRSLALRRMRSPLVPRCCHHRSVRRSCSIPLPTPTARSRCSLSRRCPAPATHRSSGPRRRRCHIPSASRARFGIQVPVLRRMFRPRPSTSVSLTSVFLAAPPPVCPPWLPWFDTQHP